MAHIARGIHQAAGQGAHSRFFSTVFDRSFFSVTRISVTKGYLGQSKTIDVIRRIGNRNAAPWLPASIKSGWRRQFRDGCS
jgi:hypothetical protein